MSRGLVQERIDRDHELETGEGLLELRAVRCGEDGIAADREQAADATVAGGEHFFGETRDGKLAAELRQASHAALPAAEAAASDADASASANHVDCGLGEHDAAGFVEVPRDEVEREDRPRSEASHLLHARADPAVDRGAFGGRELSCEATDRVRRHTAHPRRALGGVGIRDGFEHVEAIGVRGHPAELHEAFFEDHAQHREQHPGVRSGADEHVLVGALRRFGAAGIDVDHTATAIADCAQATAHVARSHDAAVGGERVRAEREEEVGAIEIGDREEELMTEREVAREHVRELVDARRAEAVLGPQRLEHERREDHRAEVVGGGVAEVRAEGVAPVFRLHFGDAIGREGDRFVPAERLPTIADPAHRALQAIGIFVQVLQRKGFGADVTAAEGVTLVATDGDHPIALDVDLDSTHRLAERTRAVHGTHGRRMPLLAHAKQTRIASRDPTSRPQSRYASRIRVTRPVNARHVSNVHWKF